MSKRITILAGTLIFLLSGFQSEIMTMPVSGTRSSDSLALVALYNSTNGANWTDNTDWLTAEPMDNWFGITMTNGRINTIQLYTNNLVGTIPPEIGNLTSMTELNLNINSLTGSIPTEIGDLTNLIFLYLRFNSLSGSIPTEIGNLTDLTSLVLRSNSLSGSIPDELCDLTNLTVLWLDSNGLTGSIPDSIGKLTNLIYLYLNNNELSGTIPVSIGLLVSANYIFLGDNKLTGAVPTEITNSLGDLVDFRINNNQLTDFPDVSVLAGLGSLTTLWIEENKFTFEDIEPNLNVSSFQYSPQDSVGTPVDTFVYYGQGITLDRTVGGANNLYQWYKDGFLYSGATNPTITINPSEWADSGAWYCYITNSLATDLTLITHPYNLSVLHNPRDIDSLALVAIYDSLGGSGWTDKTNWKSAEPLDNWYGVNLFDNRVIQLILPDNNLTGTIPEQISDMTELNNLWFDTNSISGPLPDSFTEMTALGTFYIQKNSITGQIPDEIGKLTNLVNLKLNVNAFSGSIPDNIGLLTNLVNLDLSSNDLTGPIPSSIGNLVKLDKLSLADNDLTGSIPSSIGNLVLLSDLSLNRNQLTGEIPTEIGDCTNLNNIFLERNQLSGSIPSSIGTLTVLYMFFLNDNQLTGSVPSEILNILHLDDFRINNNLLDEMPDISSLGDLTKVAIENNNFTYEDIEPNLTIANFTYAPQDSLGSPVDTTVEEKTTFAMEFSAGGTVTNYQWYKDDVLIDSATDSVLAFAPVDATDAGYYTCVITNDVATDLTLYTHPVNVTVIPNQFEIDSLALVDLYTSTNGASWDTTTNWLTAAPLENWFGITVSDGRVTQIQLSNNNLAGSVPASLYDMNALETLAIRHHQLTGSISTNIGKLTNLRSLDLAFGQLSGAIPDELGNCTELTLVVIDYNAFTGTIPQSLGNLKKLDALYLGGNHLTGTIPDTLCTLTLLRTFHLHENQLTGPIPAAIGNLDSLASIRFEANQLSGTIPGGIGNLEKLTHLWIQTNQFSGAIPTAITGMDSLKSFKIFDNQFSDFPDVSSMVPQLKWVRIWDNKFTFEDIEPNVGAGLLSFNYTPQDSVGEVVDSTITEGDGLTISVSVGGTVNQYQWMIDGVDISGAISNSYVISSAVSGDAGTYVCKITNTIASELILFSSDYNVTVNPPSGIEDDEMGLPTSYALFQNYPNPFNPTTTIRYDLPKASEVTVKIYNVFGQEVKTIVSGMQTAGRKNVIWNGRDEIGNQVASGIYFYQISSTSFNKTMKMILIK